MEKEKSELEGLTEIIRKQQAEIYDKELDIRRLKEDIAELEDELYAWKSMFRNLRKNNPKLYEKAKNYMAFEDNGVSPPPNGKWEC